MTWEWRVFWCIERSTSSECPGSAWVEGIARELRGHDFSVSLLNAGEARTDRYLHVGNNAYGLKVRDANTNYQVLELKVRTGVSDSLNQWQKVLSTPCEALHSDGVLRRRVVRRALSASYPEVVQMFEAQKQHMEGYQTARDMGSTLALNVEARKFRAVLVHSNGVEVEVSEIVVRHGAWRSVWRSLAVEGKRVDVNAILREDLFRNLYRREGGPHVASVVVGGYPSLILHVVDWVRSTW